MSLGRPLTQVAPHLKALSNRFGNELNQQTALGESLPTLAVDPSLILVVFLVVTNDVVAILVIFEERLICGLFGTLLLLQDDVVGVKHGLKALILIQTELFFARRVGLLGAHRHDGLRELFKFQVSGMACLLYLVDCGVGA